MNQRHIIKQDYSVSATITVVNEHGFFTTQKIDLKSDGWTDKTPEGLAKFIQIHVKDWDQLIVTKNKMIIDPMKKSDSQIVSEKKYTLNIARVNSWHSQAVKVDFDLTRNGKIPHNIREFFGQNGR